MRHFNQSGKIVYFYRCLSRFLPKEDEILPSFAKQPPVSVPKLSKHLYVEEQSEQAFTQRMRQGAAFPVSVLRVSLQIQIRYEQTHSQNAQEFCSLCRGHIEQVFHRSKKIARYFLVLTNFCKYLFLSYRCLRHG